MSIDMASSCPLRASCSAFTVGSALGFTLEAVRLRLSSLAIFFSSASLSLFVFPMTL